MREAERHKIEVHVAGMIFRRDAAGDCLVLAAKRKEGRALYAGLWECGGGQVHEGEDFEEAVKRQMKEEFGLDVVVQSIAGTYRIDTGKDVIPGLRFVCGLKDEENAVVTLCDKEFETFEWVREDDLDGYDFIPGIKEEIKQVIR